MAYVSVSLLGLLALVAVIDFFTYRIPNWLVVLFLVLYPVMLWLTPETVAWGKALLIGAIGLLVSFGFFALRWMGGGDAKLVAVLLLWAGMQQAVPFLILMTLAGGVLTLLLLAGRSAVALAMPSLLLLPHFPRVLQTGAPIPYGVAMALAMAHILLAFGVPGLPPL